MSNLFVLAPVLLMVVMLFFVSRGDKKKRATLEASLKKGDRVVTRAGFVGKLVELQDKHAKVEIAPGVIVTMVKSAIEGHDGGESAAKTEPTKLKTEPKGSEAESAPKKK